MITEPTAKIGHVLSNGDANRSTSLSKLSSSYQYDIVQLLRFVAALSVVLLHSSYYAAERLDATTYIYRLGGSGVRLFFVISGFVMILSSTKVQGMASGWRQFAVQRIVRIVPLYWAATLIKLAILLIRPDVVLHAQLDWTVVAKSLFFIPALNTDGDIHPLLGVGWTLNFEMMFYALFAAALFARIDPVRFLLPVLVAAAGASLFRNTNWPVPLQFWCDPIVLDFLAGMLIARWVQSGRMGLPAWTGAILFIGGLFYMLIPFPHPDYASFMGKASFTVMSAFCVIGAVVLEPRVRGRVPRTLLFLGSASYAIYLIHPLVSPAAPAALAGLGLKLPFVSVVLSVTAALMFGSMVHRWVETPLARAVQNAARASGLLPRQRTAVSSVERAASYNADAGS